MSDIQLMQCPKGSGMSLFALHLLEMARKGGYKAVIYYTPEFGQYQMLDRVKFLEVIKANANNGIQNKH